MLRPSRSGGVASARVASSSGVVNAFAAPCTARSARNGTIAGASATPNEAAA